MAVDKVSSQPVVNVMDQKKIQLVSHCVTVFFQSQRRHMRKMAEVFPTGIQTIRLLVNDCTVNIAVTFGINYPEHELCLM